MIGAFRKKTIAIMIFAAVLILAVTTVQAQVYHVDPRGAATGDGSADKPWGTISYACSRAVNSGDIIRVNAGAYTDNNVCNLAVGVAIEGAGKSVVTINTGATPYIVAASPVPVRDGNNTITGIRFNGRDQMAVAILSRGRNNQKINDCTFENYTGRGVAVYGRYGSDDNSGEFWRNDCNSTGAAPGSWCFNNPAYSAPPRSTDWARGVEVGNNTFNDCKLFPGVLSGARIHDNVFNNNGTFGARRSAIGHTAFWFDSVEIYNNRILVGAQGWSVIGIEMWEISNHSKFYGNTTDSWFSLRGSTRGLDSGFTMNYEIYGNTFAASYATADPQSALEVMSDIQGADIHHNYFSGSSWSYGVAIWGADSGANRSGTDALRNITVRNNVFHAMTNGGNLGGVHASSNQSNTVVENIRIYNNIFDANRQGINLGDGPGVLRNISIKNNIFINQTDKAIVTNGTGMGAVVVDHNMISNNKVWLGDWAGVVAESNTLKVAPDLRKTGDRPEPYYLPAGAAANVVDAGIDVGFPYSGTRPDIGPYEYIVEAGKLLTPPLGLRILNVETE